MLMDIEQRAAVRLGVFRRLGALDPALTADRHDLKLGLGTEAIGSLDGNAAQNV
jgi:hypothetical protein